MRVGVPTGVAIDGVVVARGLLGVVDLSVFFELTHILALRIGGIGHPNTTGLGGVIGFELGIGGRRRRPGGCRRLGGVVGQVLGLALSFHPQDVDVGALGHTDVAVFPAGYIDVVHHLRGTIPGGCVGLVRHCNTVDSFLDDCVGVVELEDGLVAGEVQHRLALCIRELREILVSGHHVVVAARCRRGLGGQGLAGCVGPVDVGVAVIKALDQILDKTAISRRVGVVVANLRERHVHRRVLAAHLEFVVARDLGDGRLRPSDLRHLHLAHCHLLVTRDGLDGFCHRAVRLHIHGAGARDRGRSIERDVTPGKHLHLARGGRQHSVALDHDVAPDQLVLRDGLLQPCAAPRHVNTGVELDVTV